MPGGKLVEGQVRRRHAEDVGVADRLRAQPGAERIANDATQPRVGAAVRIDSRGMVVCFHLEADVVLLVESHDAGIVGKDAHQPVAVQVFRRLEDRLFEQVVDRAATKRDPTPQRLVRAVLAPGLGERFKLAVGWLAAKLNEMALDALHLREAERKLPRSAQAARAHHPAGHGSERRRAGNGRVGLIRADRVRAFRGPSSRRHRSPARGPTNRGSRLGGPAHAVGLDRADV